MSKKLHLLPLMALAILSSCMNNVEDISDGNGIDPSEVSYSQDIQPIFSSSCGGSGCHLPNTTNGVNLSSYSAVMNSTGLSYNSEIVLAGNPEGSPLVDKIEPNPDIGARMPLTGGFLTPTEINMIKAWIEGGAEDN